MTVQKSPTEARSGITPSIVRYVLGISLVGAVLALILVWLFI
jgi:hypothetical protein